MFSTLALRHPIWVIGPRRLILPVLVLGVRRRIPGAAYQYPHGDWRIWYFTAILVFYLLMTSVSERVITRITRGLSRGQ